MQWTPSRPFPQCSVHGFAHTLAQLDVPPKTFEELQTLLKMYVYLTQGMLDISEYILNERKLHRWFRQSLPMVANSIRQLRICLIGLDEDNVLSLVTHCIVANQSQIRALIIVGRRQGSAVLTSVLKAASTSSVTRLEFQRFHDWGEEILEKDDIVAALQSMEHIQHVTFSWCDASMISIMGQGLAYKPHLQSVTLDCARPFVDDPGLGFFLGSLPHLHSLQINHVDNFLLDTLTSPHVPPVASLKRLTLTFERTVYEKIYFAVLLGKTRNLQHLTLVNLFNNPFSTDNAPREFSGTVLPNLPQLESLGADNSAILTQAMQHQRGRIANTTGQNLSRIRVEQREIYQLEADLILIGVRRNTTVTSIQMNVVQDNFNTKHLEALLLCDPTRRKPIQQLEMPGLQPVVDLLVRTLNCAALQKLVLTSVETDVRSFLQVVRNNQTLTSLSLHMTSGKAALDAWPGLIEVIRENQYLQELSFDCYALQGHHVDDLAATLLAQNRALPNVSIRGNAKHQVYADFVCRIFRQRSRVIGMVEREEMVDPLWPITLAGMSPSALYLVIPLMPWWTGE